MTILEGDWGHGKFLKFEALLEHMDKQESLIQDLQEEVTILKGNQCQCFNTGSGSSGREGIDLEYADEGAEI